MKLLELNRESFLLSEERTIGDYDISTDTDIRRIFVPDPHRPGKKRPVTLVNHDVTFVHTKTGDTVTFGSYKHQGQLNIHSPIHKARKRQD